MVRTCLNPDFDATLIQGFNMCPDPFRNSFDDVNNQLQFTNLGQERIKIHSKQ